MCYMHVYVCMFVYVCMWIYMYVCNMAAASHPKDEPAHQQGVNEH